MKIFNFISCIMIALPLAGCFGKDFDRLDSSIKLIDQKTNERIAQLEQGLRETGRSVVPGAFEKELLWWSWMGNDEQKEQAKEVIVGLYGLDPTSFSNGRFALIVELIYKKTNNTEELPYWVFFRQAFNKDTVQEYFINRQSPFRANSEQIFVPDDETMKSQIQDDLRKLIEYYEREKDIWNPVPLQKGEGYGLYRHLGFATDMELAHYLLNNYGQPGGRWALYMNKVWLDRWTNLLFNLTKNSKKYRVGSTITSIIPTQMTWNGKNLIFVIPSRQFNDIKDSLEIFVSIVFQGVDHKGQVVEEVRYGNRRYQIFADKFFTGEDMVDTDSPFGKAVWNYVNMFD
ncbi:hypothetical protein [Desulfofustis glycolicus]|uniref:Uncharacterized protein n=1 Tax=Desulfofustis glycolicus DSM 9705 TaxID=1121409 RepID=A0A1M5UKI0_9BACT|nr:hypothetical protein [Desulfofustis glycolicus]SHH63489.1 hypothetical protein SAMN02745124_01219 [Desulfofustis glycolicus DSM 9705]